MSALSKEYVNKKLDKLYEQNLDPDLDWDCWDELCFAEMSMCCDCIYLDEEGRV